MNLHLIEAVTVEFGIRSRALPKSHIFEGPSEILGLILIVSKDDVPTVLALIVPILEFPLHGKSEGHWANNPDLEVRGWQDRV